MDLKKAKKSTKVFKINFKTFILKLFILKFKSLLIVGKLVLLSLYKLNKFRLLIKK